MVGQLCVVVLETSHRDAGAALYNGLAVDTEEHVHLHTVPQPAVSKNQYLFTISDLVFKFALSLFSLDVTK